tara:strand:+ start:276 stop:461 length:186 start_codon:yes stop_codon:yes gene_type:complete
VGELIHFTIPYGDTSDPKIRAKKMANELNFSLWMLTLVKDCVDDGIISTTWRLEGWHDETG